MPQAESLLIVNCVMFFVLMPLVSITFFFYFLSIPTLIVGIISWIFLSRKIVQSQLKTIEKHGVYSTPRIYWLYVIAIFCITASTAILATQVFPAYAIAVVVIDLVFPLAPTMSITRVIAFRKWEQENNRTLYYTTGIHGKIFPYPYMFDSQTTSTQKS